MTLPQSDALVVETLTVSGDLTVNGSITGAVAGGAGPVSFTDDDLAGTTTAAFDLVAGSIVMSATTPAAGPSTISLVGTGVEIAGEGLLVTTDPLTMTATHVTSFKNTVGATVVEIDGSAGGELKVDSINELSGGAGVTIDGALIRDTGISFDAGTNFLSHYSETGPIVGAIQGAIFGPTVPITISLVRVGKTVTLTINEVFATASGGSSHMFTGVIIPSGYTPAATRVFFAYIKNAGVDEGGRVEIDSVGVISIRPLDSSTFTSSGLQQGVFSTSLTWLVS